MRYVQKTVSEMDTLDFQEHTFYNANTNEYKPRSEITRIIYELG